MENFENSQLHGCATVHLAREKLKPVLDHCLLNSSVQLSLQLRSCIARKELENQDFFFILISIGRWMFVRHLMFHRKDLKFQGGSESKSFLGKPDIYTLL